MSHFTRVRVQIKSPEHLQAALANLGHRVELGSSVRGWQGARTAAEIVIRRPNGYDIGFAKAGDGYEMVADWMGVPEGREALAREIQQEYALVAAEVGARKAGWVELRREPQTDGSVVIVGTKRSY